MLKIKNIFVEQWKTLAIVITCVTLMVGITYVLYGYTRDLLTERLQERLIAIVSTAAVQFDAEDIDKIHTLEDIEKPEFRKIVQQLLDVRAANKNIRFAYIMRRTNDPDVFEFVADAESLYTFEEADVNGNGLIDEDEVLPMPSDPFDVSEYPVMRDEAFYYPIAEPELYEDQWGFTLSGYAPIRDKAGNATAILGIDVQVNDFKNLTQETLLPFLLFIAFLVLLLTLLTILLVRIYNERVIALREIDRQKDELLSIVSHQLAQPIAALKWYLEMLMDGDVGSLTKEQQEYLHTMNASATNLADLSSMILDVSRIQLGKMKVDQQEVDLGKFLKDILDVVEPKAIEEKVELKIKIAKDLPKIVLLDRRLTRMTVENLLTNAVKYTPEKGKVTFTVENDHGVMKIEVKDTGIGIPKEEQAKIFGKQFRASNTGEIDGNGFGLYVAKGAIEAQDGKIWFESRERKGTTFFIELPLNIKGN